MLNLQRESKVKMVLKAKKQGSNDNFGRCRSGLSGSCWELECKRILESWVEVAARHWKCFWAPPLNLKICHLHNAYSRKPLPTTMLASFQASLNWNTSPTLLRCFEDENGRDFGRCWGLGSSVIESSDEKLTPGLERFTSDQSGSTKFKSIFKGNYIRICHVQADIQCA